MKKLLAILFLIVPFISSAQYAFDEVFYFDNNKNVWVQIESSGNSYLTFRDGNNVVFEYYNAKVQKNYSLGSSWLEFVKGYAATLKMASIKCVDDYTYFGVTGFGDDNFSFSTKDYNKTRQNKEKYDELRSLLR